MTTVYITYHINAFVTERVFKGRDHDDSMNFEFGTKFAEARMTLIPKADKEANLKMAPLKELPTEVTEQGQNAFHFYRL